jgi:hydroxymethylbilane synthase
VFTKELDIATMSDQIQIAVHCMKDLPTTLPQGLYMGAVLERGDTEDVLVLPLSHEKYQRGSLEDLKDGAVIGTSAMRRSASIAKHYPKLVCKNIRGNVNTRLAKLDRSATTSCEPLKATSSGVTTLTGLPSVLRLCSQW